MGLPFAFIYATFVPARKSPRLPLPFVSKQLIFLALFWWNFRKDLGNWRVSLSGNCKVLRRSGTRNRSKFKNRLQNQLVMPNWKLENFLTRILFDLSLLSLGDPSDFFVY